MKVSNSQKPTKGDDGVARETLNDWQKRDTRVRSEASLPSDDSDKVKETERYR
jgi:hypothetical protein